MAFIKNHFWILILVSLMTYLISLEISRQKKIALLSSVFLAVGFWSNYIAYFALSDSLLVVFILISLYFSIKILKIGSLKFYILAAIFASHLLFILKKK